MKWHAFVLLIFLTTFLLRGGVVIAEEATSAQTTTADNVRPQASKEQTWKEIVDDCVAKTKQFMEENKKEEALVYLEAQRAKYAAMPEYKDNPDLLPRLTWIEADVMQDVGTLYANKGNWLRAEDYYEKAVIMYLGLRKTVVARYKNFQRTAGDCDDPDKGGAVQNLLVSALRNGKKDPDHAGEFLKRYTQLCGKIPDSAPGKQK